MPVLNAQRMAETVGHLIDHVIPPVPVRQRVMSVPKRLRWFVRSGLLDADDAGAMLAWDNGGFSLDVSVRIGGRDHAGLSIVSERTGADPWFLLVPRSQRSIPSQLEWGTGVSARSRIPELNVRYLDSTRERPPGLEGPELAEFGC